ncbi:WEB family [Melia azedarach]|uniref:WEB family n=1 Tax=Melia azedarach TaxID=155640 RepID=A0ACC1YAS2_MELAZ|nr:WEB family [Melia azedarach]
MDSVHEPVPGTPGIREVRSESGTENFGFCEVGGGASFGIRKVGLRAEIDTSPPFGSVKEAVTRFGGSESWPPLYKLGEYHGVEEFDIKKVEEQAAELEKDLIVKELETLDVLEELGTTKKIVEELKLQLQKEALKCMATPEIKEMNQEHQRSCPSNNEQIPVGNSSPCPVSSPDLILMELKQAKLNLGRTINDLGVIQTSVESLNKRMKKEKTLLEKTRERMTRKFAGVSTLEEELKQVREQPQIDRHEEMKNFQVNLQGEQLKKLAEVSKAMLGNEQSVKTAEMRWVAAKKMEEAAKAAEALALAEIKALSGSEKTSGYFLPEPEGKSPVSFKTKKSDQGLPKKKVALAHAVQQLEEANISKLAILKMMEEAIAEVKHSKQALEDALNRVEIANRKQLAAGEALRKWAPDCNYKQGQAMYSPARFNIIHPSEYQQNSPLNEVSKPELISDEPKPVLRPTVSMRDVLSRKQVLSEECVVRRQAEGPTAVRQKVALSQMLQELREDLTYPKKSEIDCDDQQKQFFAQRRKFGFIHISLPLTRQSKKKMQGLNTMG